MNSRDLPLDAPSVLVRKAVLADAEILWEWRNEPTARFMSGSTSAIPWETHLAWYSAALVNERRWIFIGLDHAAVRVGMCRFDVETDDSCATVSLVLDPLSRGRGLSTILLREAMKQFLDARPMNLRAYIRPENAASLHCFTRAGFHQSGVAATGLLELVHAYAQAGSESTRES